MKCVTRLGLFVTAIFLTSCSHNDAPQGQYQNTAIFADGYANDWQFPLRFANEGYTFSYNVTNDKKNIYIVVNSRNYEMEQRVLKYGMTFYFDEKGAKHKTKLLTFPEKKGELSNSKTKGTKTFSDEWLIKNSNAYHVEGLLTLDNGEYALQDMKSKIQVAVQKTTDNGLVCEVVIPINYILTDGLTSKVLKKNFSVGIEVHQIDVANSKKKTNYNKQTVQPRISMGGGMRGGGLSMGMGGGRRSFGGNMNRQNNYNNQQNNTQSTPEIEWYQFKLVGELKEK
jgi:hypothetical protein